MKDYFAKSPLNQEVKDFIMKIAKVKYFDAGHTIGWNVCDDENRELYITRACRLYHDIILPYTTRQEKQAVANFRTVVLEHINNLMTRFEV